MDTLIANYVQQLNPGTVQTFQNMAVMPLTTDIEADHQYITLNEAMENGALKITEVDESGSIPELKVVNSSEHQILLLDGEELVGAKQNRVLNTSILLRQKSETIIPVSCTEMGRWAYTSETFSESGAIMARTARSNKLRTVSDSLDAGMGPSSDQAAVWSDISAMHMAADTSSPTSAMRDMYTEKNEELGSYAQAFELIPEQRGILVFVNGEVAGFDIVSLKSAYRRIHPQLIKSYAVDALLRKTDQAPASVDLYTPFPQGEL